MTARWTFGDLILRREVLGLAPRGPSVQPAADWLAKPWMVVPVFVVEDSDEALVTYIAPGAEFGFPLGVWPTPDGRHPWSGRRGWSGHGALMVQKPGEHHAVWHFWTGPERTFAYWYVNLQTAFVRTAVGYDTQDLELDIVVQPDGRWTLKDLELLDQRVAAEEIAYAKKILALEKNYAASGQAVGVAGEVFLDKPIVEQYRRLLRNAGELDD